MLSSSALAAEPAGSMGCPALNQNQQRSVFASLFGKDMQPTSNGASLAQANYSVSRPQTNVFIGSMQEAPLIYLHVQPDFLNGLSLDYQALFEQQLADFNALTDANFRTVLSPTDADVELVLGSLAFADQVFTGLSLDNPRFSYYFNAYGPSGEKRRFWQKQAWAEQDFESARAPELVSTGMQGLLFMALGLRTRPEASNAAWQSNFIACLKGWSLDDPMSVVSFFDYLARR